MYSACTLKIHCIRWETKLRGCQLLSLLLVSFDGVQILDLIFSHGLAKENTRQDQVLYQDGMHKTKTCKHAHMHTLHTCTHAHFTHMHTCTPYTHAHFTHMHTLHTCTHMHTLHTCTLYTHAHFTHMHTYTHAHLHTCTLYTHAHLTHIHTYTHPHITHNPPM